VVYQHNKTHWPLAHYMEYGLRRKRRRNALEEIRKRLQRTDPNFPDN